MELASTGQVNCSERGDGPVFQPPAGKLELYQQQRVILEVTWQPVTTQLTWRSSKACDAAGLWNLVYQLGLSL